MLATPQIIIPNGQTNFVKPFAFNADYWPLIYDEQPVGALETLKLDVTPVISGNVALDAKLIINKTVNIDTDFNIF